MGVPGEEEEKVPNAN